ncbi:coiled-coil domain-containing protein 112-like [Ostrinia furnacalis]|uniref:coiled-coil domain-containing protein 112-like n=1 Tax=Ostrinia furnacalis TaxID=93504 RepID=UPI00103C9FA0|nr:coiled-coil domain-containing protein 112-like [Ostrinia furnacalis]
MSDVDISNESSKNLLQNSSCHDDGILARIRRLKIQEDLMIQSIKKNFGDDDNDFIKCDFDCKRYINKLKSSFVDIKQLYDDLKCITKSQDTIRNSDIDDVKKHVLELDEHIKTFKKFLHRELATLKTNEEYLLKQINAVENQTNKVIKHTKVISKTYSDIIPSPVRNIINSPFKYPEVQQFQDFLSHTNKYGGWNEYNHNIFIKIWQKHFPSNDDAENLCQTDTDLFIQDVSNNISGLTQQEITAHLHWYIKYLSHKKRQQLAIEEWRAKTRPKKDYNCNKKSSSSQSEIENVSNRTRRWQSSGTRTHKKAGELHKQDHDSNTSLTTEGRPNNMSLVDTNAFLKEMERSHNLLDDKVVEFSYAKSTEQWSNRCQSSADPKPRLVDLDNISKRGTPNWRLKLL